MNRTVKCLVWDLDDTLWRGTLSEDPEVTVPAAIRAAITELDRRGILQSVASRNDHDHAWARLEELGLAEFLITPQIGWGPKSHAVRAIADRLGFDHRTIAFIDDRPAERFEVSSALPEVRCYPAEDAGTLTTLPEFSPATVTEDSRQRRVMYQGEVLRRTERESFAGGQDDFLRTLDLDLRVRRATEADLARVEELTLRTSQMNATGVHYSAATLRGMLDDAGHEVLVATLTDRFGPHGAVAVVLLAKRAAVWNLKLLTTSCRVIPYGIGSILLRWLTAQAAAAHVHLVADFVPTDRNRMMAVAYRFAGFTGQPCACVADLPAAPAVQRMHLVAVAQEPPTVLRVSAPELTAGGTNIVVWAAKALH